MRNFGFYDWRFYLLLALLVLPSITFAASGASFNGQCFVDVNSAAAAFSRSFPMTTGASIVNLQSSAVAGSGVTFTTVSTSLNSSSMTTTSGTLTFLDCDSDTFGWSQVQVSVVVLYSALMICFFIGVRMGFLV